MKKNTEENTGKKTEEQLPKKEKKWRKKSTSSPKKESNKEQNKKGNNAFRSLSDVQDFIKDAGAFKKDAKEWSSKQIETLQILVEKLEASQNSKFISFQMLKGMPQISNVKNWVQKVYGKKSDIDKIFYGKEEPPPEFSEQNNEFQNYLESKFRIRDSKDAKAIFFENLHHLPAVLEVIRYFTKLNSSSKSQLEKTECFLSCLLSFSENFLSLGNSSDLRTTGDINALEEIFSRVLATSAKPQQSADIFAEMIRWAVAFKESIEPEIKKNLEAIQQLEKIKSKQLLEIDEIKQSKLQIQEKLETVTKQNEILQNQINQEKKKYEDLWQNYLQEQALLKKTGTESLSAKLEEINKSISNNSQKVRAFLEREEPKVEYALMQLEYLDQTLRKKTEIK